MIFSVFQTSLYLFPFSSISCTLVINRVWVYKVFNTAVLCRYLGKCLIFLLFFLFFCLYMSNSLTCFRMLSEESLIHYFNHTSPAGNYKWPMLQYSCLGRISFRKGYWAASEKGERNRKKNCRKKCFPPNLWAGGDRNFLENALSYPLSQGLLCKSK